MGQCNNNNVGGVDDDDDEKRIPFVPNTSSGKNSFGLQRKMVIVFQSVFHLLVKFNWNKLQGVPQ